MLSGVCLNGFGEYQVLIMYRWTEFFWLIWVIILTGSAGCVPITADTSEEREQLTEMFVGNALPIVKLDSLKAQKLLVPASKSKAYVLDDRVGIEGEYYVFNVYTPFGTVLVKGVASLVEYCYDAEVMEMLLSSNFGEVLDITIDSSISEYNNQVLDSKVYKIDSIAGIGRRFNQAYSEDFDRNIIVDNILDRNTLHGAYYDTARLTLAYKLGLDQYSANPYVQRFLTALAGLSEDDLRGIMAMGLVQPDINIHRGQKNIDASAQSRTLFPGSRNLLLENRLINSDPLSINVNLSQLYGSVFTETDITSTSVEKLLSSPHYSVREQLYIFAYLNDMKGVKNKNGIVALMAGVSSAFEAKQYYLQMQLLHAYYVGMGGLRQFIALSSMIGAVDNADQIIVIPTWDHTREREEVRKLLVEVNNFKKSLGVNTASIWFVGDCDKNTKTTARKAGINISDGVAMEKIFRFTTYRKLTYEFQPGDPVVQNAARLTPNPVVQYQRVNRPLPTVLLPDADNPAKGASKEESTIVIQEPDKPKPKKHDPRNWREFGIGVKIIPKEELDAGGVPGISSEGVGNDFDMDETGSGEGVLPPRGEDPVKASGEPVF